jgi:hypothetical protein
MSSTVQSKESTASKWGWGILLAVAALVTVNGAALGLFVFETALERNLAILLAGLGLQSLVAALTGLRSGARWAWNATWVLFAVLVAIGLNVVFGGGEDPTIGLWYFFLAAMVLAGQILAARGLPR